MVQPAVWAENQRPELERGCRVAGRYHVDERIHVSANETRYQAYDEAQRRWVQLILRPNPTVRDARLVHDGIVQPTDLGCIGAWFVSVLDPGTGEGMQRLLARLGGAPVDLDSVMVLGLGLLDSLHHLDRWDLVHGDLSPEGIHLTPDFDPILLGVPSTGPVTEAGLPFAAPERHCGEPGDARADVYAVGAILYTLHAGLTPFGTHGAACREGHLSDPVPPTPRISAPVLEVLRCAMAKEPIQRFPDARAFASALTDAYHQTSNRWMREPATDLEEAPGPAPVRQADVLPAMPPDDPSTDFELNRAPTPYGGPVVVADPRTHSELIELALVADLDAEMSLSLDLDTDSVLPLDLDGDCTLKLVGIDAEPWLELDETSELYLPDILGFEPPAAPRRDAGTASGMALSRELADWEDTLEPPLPRTHGGYDLRPVASSWEGAEQALPQILLVILCSLALGLAGAAILMAGLVAQLAF